MQCSQCKNENPAGAAFCNACGVALPATCKNCGWENPTDSTFCNSCGHELSHLSTPSESQSADPSTPSGERRQATVLFSDLSGYTAMNEKLDPEEVHEIMSRIKSEAVKIVENHGGIVNQFVGDEVLALFGIPTAHEDDPRRAVAAALELHELARNLSGEVEPKIGRSLRMHTGIHYGLIVTSLRDDRDGRVGVTGDTVNVGAHLASKAKADEIIISAETYKLVAPYFNTEALKPFKMKGKSQALTPYRVTGKSQVETRLEASEKRGFTVFTGRERELEALYNFLEKATGGEGHRSGKISWSLH